jgi:hypothetical protein
MAITPEQVARRMQLHALGTFKMHSLLAGDNWEYPEAGDVKQVLSMISMTDIALSNRLDVDERTIRKWKSGQTRMVFTTWCCLCWLAGLGMLLEEPA